MNRHFQNLLTWSVIVGLVLTITTASLPVVQEEQKPKSHTVEERPLEAAGTGVVTRATIMADQFNIRTTFYSIGGPAWKVTLVIQNFTDEELQLGESLIMLEFAGETRASSYVAREGAQGIGDLEADEIMAIGPSRIRLRYGLDGGYTVGHMMPIFDGDRIVDVVFPGHVTFIAREPYLGLGYGRVSPHAERTIEALVPFLRSIPNRKSINAVVVIPPSVRPVGPESRPAVQTVIRFSAGERGAGAILKPVETQTVPVAVADLWGMASDTTQLLWLRTFALNWMAETDLSVASPLLIEAATTNSNPELLRNVAIVNLGTFKVRSAAQPLIGMVQQPINATIRRWALDTLGDIGDLTAAPTVREHINAADYNVATAAIEAAGELKDTEAVPALLAILGDDKQEERHNTAGSALAAIASHDAVVGLADMFRTGRKKVRERAAETLRSVAAVVGKDVADAVAVALSSHDREVRQEAAEILGRTPAADAITPLWEAYQRETEEIPGGAIASALIRLGFSDQSAIGLLIGRLDPKRNKLWFSNVLLLRHLSGQNFGPAYKEAPDRDRELVKWREWWANRL